MSIIPRNKGRGMLWLVTIILVTVTQAVEPTKEAPLERTDPEQSMVSRKVMAFYYPWYGIADGPGGAGRTVHWGRIDAANKNISGSTNYPTLGAYDSHDPAVIEQHCRWARQAGIDTLIVSWWGHNNYEDRAMGKILAGCERHGLTACIYYETVPNPVTAENAADDIIRVLSKYAKHSAYLKVDNKPVIFVYGRALNQLGLASWLKAIKTIKAKNKKGITIIGDQFSYGAARVFDGVHTYNTAGSLRGLSPPAVREWAGKTYPAWVKLADQAHKISTVTVIPGYDDTKIRKPGLAVERYETKLYQAQWAEAIAADPHWILITSFNEWHEGSEIEPSLPYQRQYLDLTARYARQFKAKIRPTHQYAKSDIISPEEKALLNKKYEGLRIGILPNAQSSAFWWLVDMGITVETLSWQEVVQGNLTAKRYPILLYCGPEQYQRSVAQVGDVDGALTGYLKTGGCLTVLPAMPWPFYYDENGQAVNRSSQFGLSLRPGWEKPPQNKKLHFRQTKNYLPHLPSKFAFPDSGDWRWRPMIAETQLNYTSLLQLHDHQDKNYGDAIALAELKGGGRIFYTWFRLLDGPDADKLLYDIFDFLAVQRSGK